MNLYPVIIFRPAVVVRGPNLLPPGTLGVVPINMTDDDIIVQVKIVHVSLTQDFSLRYWVSPFIDGLSVMPHPGFFPVLRGNGLPIVLYSHFPPLYPCIPVLIRRRAVHYFNVLNLTNEGNQFTFEMSISVTGTALAGYPIAEIPISASYDESYDEFYDESG